MNLLVEHTIKSIENAEKLVSDIDATVLAVDGGSSPKIRHFLNNITKFDGCNYLEIGTWKGSTLISALFKNHVKNCWAIDNFNLMTEREREDTTEAYINNCMSTLGYVPPILNEDFISFDPVIDYGIKDVNVYFYDGDHEKCNGLNMDSHELALTHYLKSMQDEFIFICDDWNRVMEVESTPNDVRTRYNWNVEGITRNTIKKLNLTVLYEIALPARYWGDVEQWWSGFYVSVLKKPTT
jgi:hypothetical protein